MSPPSCCSPSSDARSLAGGGPPVDALLTRGRDHGRHEHQQVDRHPCADQRGREPAERLAYHHEAGAIADARDHRVGVLRQARGVVVARQVDRDHIVAPHGELGVHQMPVPGRVCGTMDENEGGHVRPPVRFPAGRSRACRLRDPLGRQTSGPAPRATSPAAGCERDRRRAFDWPAALALGGFRNERVHDPLIAATRER